MAKKSLLDILAGFSDDELKTLLTESRNHRTRAKFAGITFDLGDDDEGDEGEGEDDGKIRKGFFG